MIQAIIKIRIKQISRAIISLGMLRTIFLSGLIIFLFIGMFVQMSKVPNNKVLTGALLLIILIIHSKRTDKSFLKIISVDYKMIYLTEYLLLSIPLIICQIYYHQWLILSLTFILIYVITILDFKKRQNSVNTKIQRLIPNNCFEWKAGVRKNIIFIVLIWTIGISASFFVGSVPIAIFILGITILNFYEKGEPLQMLIARELNAKKLLGKKIKDQIFLFSVIVIPLIIVFIIFHPENWYIPLGEYLLFLFLLTYVVLLKYAFFEPNKKSEATQFFSAIGVISIFIPFLIPVVLILALRFYFKSLSNLNFYLNDFN